MTRTIRNPREAAQKEYDAIIVGGGIYGITLALEAGFRGRKTLLLEKGDFGEHTSFNSLRIIHGGLRYLQSLDLHRFRESVRERSWFLRNFPQRVKPMPCLMPLYGRGLKRPSVFRLALLLNHLLSLDRNRGLNEEHRLPIGGICSPEETKSLFPLVDEAGLQGAALWYDAQMEDSQLLLMDILQQAQSKGTTAINYCQVESITTQNGMVTGVTAKDRESGDIHHFRGLTVINSGGPWAGKLVKGLGGDADAIYRPSLAWNVLFNRRAISSHALAVQAKRPGSRALFVTPWKGRIFAGCGHEGWTREVDRPMPTRTQLNHFIEELNEAIPGLNLSIDEVARVCCGLLPTVATGSNILTKREVIVDHERHGGPSGLYSVGGIKFTTARLVAEKIWSLVDRVPTRYEMSPPPVTSDPSTEPLAPADLVHDPSIVHLDDLVLRRSSLWDQGEQVDLALLADLMTNWDEQRRSEEITRCMARLAPLREDLFPRQEQHPKHQGKQI